MKPAHGTMRSGSIPIIELVARRLQDDPTVSTEVADIVLDALGATGQPNPPEEAGSERLGTAIFLRAIRVRGFRGIGKETALELFPGPGLTLVVGRNGSGKSSFAEAAELSLTGANRRWEGRSAAWREGWRNLHEPHPRIDVELLDGRGNQHTTVTKQWAPGADLADAEWQQRGAAGAIEPFPAARWSVPLELYRPFLSYSELGALVDGKPSELFDALHQLLGLDELIAVHEDLRARRLELDRGARWVRQQHAQLLADLDEAGEVTAELLRDPTPDLDALDRALSVCSDSVEPAALHALAGLALPAAGVVDDVAARLAEHGAAVAGQGTVAAESDLRVLELLRQASHHAAAVGSCRCPVCGAGYLDEVWAHGATSAIEELTERVSALTSARARLDLALSDLRALAAPIPAELTAGRLGVQALDTEAVREAWAHWVDTANADYSPELPTRLCRSYAHVRDELDFLQQGVRKELERLDEARTPWAARLREWLDAARTVAARTDELRTIRRSEEWVKAATARLRDERMAPLEDTARWVWQSLRQQSNVELGAVRLQGNANTARRVLLDVTVDEVDGAALGVMSQGELHALGLSLFLPRATVTQSPFRFVMIDDPVQAMDPAKIDGLARVLATVARDRQVIVFTHDERLAEAVRRMQIEARILEVQRRERSVTEVRVSSDPVRRYLDDARALVRTPQLPSAIADELVATCCRSALEAASLARARRLMLTEGIDHDEVQHRIDAAQSTRAMLTLAVLGASGRIENLNKRLAREGDWAVAALRDATAGAHVPIGRNMSELIIDTEKLVDWLSQ